jgi:chemotaxis protein methyltransferase CheR
VTSSSSTRRARLAEAVRAFAGLDPPAWLFDARVAERAAALGLDEADYLEHATGDDGGGTGEQEALANLLRVGETRFFRHRAHVTALRERVLPERVEAARAAGRPLRVWSAGCATGEEAWTLAMLAHEATDGTGYGGGFSVLATDLSPGALGQAERGRYAQERIADVPPALRARWFSDEGEVRDQLRAQVHFQRHNLLAPARYPGGFDVILCRNVLIYFDGARRGEVIGRLCDALTDGGVLFLGYAETLRDQEAHLTAERDDDGVIYRKRSPTDRPAPPLSPETPARTPAPSLPRAVERAVEQLVARRPERALVALCGEYHDEQRLAHELRSVIATGGIVDLDGATFLGDEAARVLERAFQAAPTLTLRATRASIRRWLARHGLDRP